MVGFPSPATPPASGIFFRHSARQKSRLRVVETCPKVDVFSSTGLELSLIHI